LQLASGEDDSSRLTPLSFRPPQLDLGDHSFHGDKLLGSDGFEVPGNLGVIGQRGSATKAIQIAARTPGRKRRFDPAEFREPRQQHRQRTVDRRR
jgi:hypothetical protein